MQRLRVTVKHLEHPWDGLLEKSPHPLVPELSSPEEDGSSIPPASSVGDAPHVWSTHPEEPGFDLHWGSEEHLQDK